jgi:hypothetical protein
MDAAGTTTPHDRRRPRRRVALWFNKYIGGRAHVAEILEISESGLLARSVNEPDVALAIYGVEIGRVDLPDERVWLCARSVWREAGHEGLEFVAMSDRDREKLKALLAAL